MKIKSKGKFKIKEKGKEIAIIVLSVLLLASLLTGGFWVKDVLINKIFAKTVAKKTIDYINKNLLPSGVTATLESASAKSNGLYEIKFKILDKEYDSYVSSDGKLFFPEGIALVPSKDTKQTTQTTIPKKDKADAKLFVMSFCPYGNEAEVAIKPVVDLLKDKATIEVHYIVSKDGSKYSSLHGEQEANQDVRELCVQKYQKAKYWDFVLAINNGATAQDVDSKWEAIAKNVGVDVAKIKDCQQKEYSSLLDAEITLSQKYGAEGSPTLVINETTYQGDRTANAYKEGICSGFQTAPTECKTQLSNEASTAASGGCSPATTN